MLDVVSKWADRMSQSPPRMFAARSTWPSDDARPGRPRSRRTRWAVSTAAPHGSFSRRSTSGVRQLLALENGDISRRFGLRQGASWSLLNPKPQATRHPLGVADAMLREQTQRQQIGSP